MTAIIASKVPNHQAIYYTGPDIASGQLPALIYLALSAEESLTLDPYNQPVQFLHGKPIRVFSFTLPCHGPHLNKTHAMQCWSDEIKKNENFLTEFIKSCSDKIDALIKENIIDPKHLSVAGLSRGAFLATHLAAVNKHIHTILGFAPLTSLEFLEEFKDNKNCKQYDLSHLNTKLIRKHLRFYIGNHDIRVGTKECFKFINLLSLASYDAGVRSPQIELNIFPSVGYKGHGTLPPVFQDGINWLLSHLT
jgi:esterase FrsA